MQLWSLLQFEDTFKENSQESAALHTIQNFKKLGTYKSKLSNGDLQLYM